MGKDLVFVNGIIKSREKYLVEYDAFLRMIDADTAKDAFKMLAEYNYGKGEESAEVFDYEKVVGSEWKAYREFLKEYAPDWFVRAFTAKNDFHNAEAALRQKRLKLSDGVFVEDGVFDKTTILAAAEKGVGLPKELIAAIKKCGDGFDEMTGSEISLEFIKAYYAYTLKTVKNATWKDCLRFEIDALNIACALRAEDIKTLDDSIILGGKLKKDVLHLIFDGQREKVKDLVKGTPYQKLIETGFEEREAGGALVGFEQAAESHTLSVLIKKRFESEGVIPLLLYSNYKLNEIKNVRLVIALKLAGADGESIKKRLKVCYA